MKKKRSLFYLFFWCLLIFWSCGNEPINDQLPVYENFDDIQKEWEVDTTQVVQLSIPEFAEPEFFFSQFVDTSWSVPLETNSESIIGAADKILIYQDIIFISDIRKAKHLLAFDLKGKFLFKVGQQGPRPGCYLQPDDFCINKEEQKIVVYDDYQRKLLLYTLEGTFLEERKMTFYLYGIDHLKNDEYVLNSFGRTNPSTQDIPYRLLLEKAGEVLQKGLPYQKVEEKLSYRTSPFEFSHFENELLYSPNFLGQTFAINSSGIQLKYQLDFGEQGLPMSFKKMELSQFLDTFHSQDGNAYAYYFGPLFETAHHLTFNLMKGGHFQIGFYTKQSKDVSYGTVIDDLPNSLKAFRFYTTYQDQYLIGCGDSYYFTEDRAKYGQAKSKEIVELLDRLSPTDNPVLSFYKLKEPKRTLSGL